MTSKEDGLRASFTLCNGRKEEEERKLEIRIEKREGESNFSNLNPSSF